MTADSRTDLPYPGDELVYRVTGTIDVSPADRREWFFHSGRLSVDAIDAALAVAGRELQSFDDVLDFGCGPGRILLWLQDVAESGTGLHGADIDPRAIRWAREHIPWASFVQNEPEPPLPYEDGRFDLVLNHSVFTHIDECYQDRWLTELHRVTRPGGLLLLSVNGAHAFGDFERQTREQGGDTAPVRTALERDGIVFLREDSWFGSAFPDFYHSTFHLPAYVMDRWSWFFEVRAYLPRHALGHQDVVVLERREGALPVGSPPRRRGVQAEAVVAARDGSPLERAAVLLAREPGPPAEQKSSFGPAGAAARRAVLRVLKPYSANQRQLDQALFDALTQFGGRGTFSDAATLRAGLLRQSERISRLELELIERIDELSARLDAAEKRQSNPTG